MRKPELSSLLHRIATSATPAGFKALQRNVRVLSRMNYEETKQVGDALTAKRKELEQWEKAELPRIHKIV
jgi:hypothetical protein